MAQYTPNFNLYEPDSSDDFADFRTEFNNNMNIIDQNLGGGGSGGHTIYDKDGNALAQESGLQFTGNVNVSDDSVNGRTVVDILGGGGNVYGAFVDTDRVIQSSTTLTNDNSTTYTATEDCAVIVGYYGTATDGYIKINGVNASTVYVPSNSPLYLCETVYVRKGQVVTMKSVQNNGAYTVYGLTQGTNGIYAPVIYSDNERVIGVWRDNKPLYQKTLVVNNLNLDTSGTPIDITSLGVEMCTPIYGGSYYIVSGVKRGFAKLEYQQPNEVYLYPAINRSNTTCYVTIQYTKTADIAGSGNWNTDGVPTHHYSTSEQVIGTWIDGKPLYERVYTGLSIPLNGNDWVYYNDPVDVENVIDFKAFADNSGRLLNCAITEYQRSNTNGIMFSGITGFNRTVNIIVAQITKTTD